MNVSGKPYLIDHNFVLSGEGQHFPFPRKEDVIWFETDLRQLIIEFVMVIEYRVVKLCFDRVTGQVYDLINTKVFPGRIEIYWCNSFLKKPCLLSCYKLKCCWFLIQLTNQRSLSFFQGSKSQNIYLELLLTYRTVTMFISNQIKWTQ